MLAEGTLEVSSYQHPISGKTMPQDRNVNGALGGRESLDRIMHKKRTLDRDHLCDGRSS